MIRFLLVRLAQALLVLLVLAVIVFGISRLSGSPVDLMLPEGATPADRQALIERLALDRPIHEQLWTFLVQAVQGDFGQSSRFHMPAMDLVASRLPNTILLAFASIGIAIVMGIPLGVRAALRHDRATDTVISTFAASAQAIPAFWFAIIMLLVFGVWLRWLPISGFESWSSLVLPAVSLSLLPLVTIIRITRSSVLSVLPEHYVETARAKGMPRRIVTRRHILRNALIPVVTVTGLLLGSSLSGAVITEQIFAWPGIGSLAIEAIKARDYGVVQCIAIIAGAAIILCNLAVDLSYRFLDPRTRKSTAKATAPTPVGGSV